MMREDGGRRERSRRLRSMGQWPFITAVAGH